MSAYDHRQQYERAHGARHDAQYDSAQYDASYDEYGSYEDTYARDSYGRDPYPEDSYARSGAARASASPAPARSATAVVGAAPAGRARVPTRVGEPGPPGSPVQPGDDIPRPRYDWSGARPAGAAAGRATVPVSPGPAGPVTGRATVRPGGPAGGAPGGPGRPGGPGGMPPGRKRKRHWVRNTLLSSLAVLVMIAGGGMVALSYYVESVPPPAELDLEEASTIFYRDGSEMAVLQEVHREIIDTTVPELKNVRDAVVAAEDKDFYSHSGVDFAGIVRAAINNVRGGPRSGASTIDQQYARRAANIYEDSYGRKLQEAAMAYKMNQSLKKPQILDFYLNTIYFGRGAHGVQAAAQAYFGKDAVELGADEAALLAGIIRLPDGGSGLSPYDPLYDPENPQIALDRWYYVLNQMVDIGALTPEERAELTELPEVIDPKNNNDWHEGPQGNIVRQVQRELEEMGFTDLATGGYRVTTTIDPEIQKAARKAARRKSKGDHWQGMPDNVTAAIVAIDPETGAVLGYYGGEDGTAFDTAGKNWDPELGWHGGRPPGSSFKIYTTIAALREGVSLDTHWKTSEYDPGFGPPIRNAGRDARNSGCEGQAPDYCTLRWSVQQSFNVPFFHFAESVPGQLGAARIVEAAHDAGIRMMTGVTLDEDGKAVRDIRDLTQVDDFSELGRDPFDYHVAFGQYPITVLDHASGVATLAARGVYHEPHFVAKVEQRIDGEWQPIGGDRISGERRIQTEHADALTGVLSTIPQITGVPLEGGRPAAAKTGTWEHASGEGNADAWMVGYTPQIAAAVWVGAEDNSPIFDQTGRPMPSSGLPSQIWKLFMDAAHSTKEYSHAEFPPAPPVGDPQHPYANGEPEEERRRPGDPRCLLPWVVCDPPDDDDDNGNGRGRGGDQGGETSPPPPDDPGTDPPDDDE